MCFRQNFSLHKMNRFKPKIILDTIFYKISACILLKVVFTFPAKYCIKRRLAVFCENIPIFYCRALRVRKKMCGKGQVINMIGDMLCENVSIPSQRVFMPPKELWESYSNRTVRPSVRVSVRVSVCPAFVSGPYLLYSLR